MTSGRPAAPEGEQPEPTVRVTDRRRVDPDTGEARPDVRPAATETTTASATSPAGAASERLAELTADLQRITAEYANYRKRVDRDREAVKDQQVATLATKLLPALDDIERAREHGDLNGAFASVAEQLLTALSSMGLEQYGQAGEPFDPNLHDALQVKNEQVVTEPTVIEVVQPGYRIGERIVRPAHVVVAQPVVTVEQE
jgi:molecular chaperone GrpE